MFKVVKKQIRPNTSVDFFTIATDTELRAYLLEKYFQPGKMQRPEVVVSEDGLEQTITSIYASAEAAMEWRDDPVVVEKVHNAQEAYCAANGIELLPYTVIDETQA